MEKQLKVEGLAVNSAVLEGEIAETLIRDAQQKNEVIKKLRKSFKTLSRDMGQRKWTREVLHER